MPEPAGTLLLGRGDVRSIMRFEDYLDAVETAFRLRAEGRIESPPVVDLTGRGGTFHVKAAAMDREGRYAAVKVNGNFPRNGIRFGLPTIQGAIFLCDGETGRPLAVMDSIEITLQRTAAATALAARHLARPGSETATICGCGAQASAQLLALRHVLPLKRVFAFDAEVERARRFAASMAAELGIPVRAVATLGEAARESDVIVTCTTSREPFLGLDELSPGVFVAAVGADAHDKQELAPDILARSKLVVDLLDQCATIGELHHALRLGLMSPQQVHAELGEVVAGKKPGRVSGDEIAVFDSTGTAIQDVSSAIRVYQRARDGGIGSRFDLSA